MPLLLSFSSEEEEEVEEDEDKMYFLIFFHLRHINTPLKRISTLRHKRGFFPSTTFCPELSLARLLCLPRLKVFSFKYCHNFLFILPHIVTVDVFIAVDVWLVPARIFLQKS